MSIRPKLSTPIPVARGFAAVALLSAPFHFGCMSVKSQRVVADMKAVQATVDGTPRQLLSSKCISYSEAILQYRRSAVSNDFAVSEGVNLFNWFAGLGALSDEKAPIAVRSVELGITLLKTSPETAESIRQRVMDNYVAYAGGD